MSATKITMKMEWQLSRTSILTLLALKLKQTQIPAGISIVPSLSSGFFELCSPTNDCSVKVPPLYLSIFVPLYIESLYSHTVQ